MVENDTLTIARTIGATRRLTASWRARGLTVGLVPTMGWLHAGHLALVARARAQNDRVLATIFVNPLQFGPAEDFTAYPRDDERDFGLLREQRCDAVFAPPVAEMFPDGNATLDDVWTRVSVGPLAAPLCGESRPTHFDGVATIVLKLLQIAQPDRAYFGEKDYQQLTIVKRMVHDLNVPVRIEGVPIVRESDGLALSSRNVYLTSDERAAAPALHRALHDAREALTAGGPAGPVLAAARMHIGAAGFEVDYVTLADGETLSTLDRPRRGARLFAAARLGRTRLIDNIAVTSPAR